MMETQWNSLQLWYEGRIIAGENTVMPRTTSEMSPIMLPEGQNGAEGEKGMGGQTGAKGQNGVEGQTSTEGSRHMIGALQTGKTKAQITSDVPVNLVVKVVDPKTDDKTRHVKGGEETEKSKQDKLWETVSTLTDSLKRTCNVNAEMSKHMFEVIEKSKRHDENIKEIEKERQKTVNEQLAVLRDITSNLVKICGANTQGTAGGGVNMESVRNKENVNDEGNGRPKKSPERCIEKSANDTKELAEAIKMSLMNKNPGVKRDYKLDAKMKYEHFFDLFKSEIRANELYHIIDKSVQSSADGKKFGRSKIQG